MINAKKQVKIVLFALMLIAIGMVFYVFAGWDYQTKEARGRIPYGEQGTINYMLWGYPVYSKNIVGNHYVGIADKLLIKFSECEAKINPKYDGKSRPYTARESEKRLKEIQDCIEGRVL